jgi:hypothetical protein
MGSYYKFLFIFAILANCAGAYNIYTGIAAFSYGRCVTGHLKNATIFDMVHFQVGNTTTLRAKFNLGKMRGLPENFLVVLDGICTRQSMVVGDVYYYYFNIKMPLNCVPGCNILMANPPNTYNPNFNFTLDVSFAL